MFILDASGIDGRDPSSDFKVLRDELKAYNPEMLDRPYFVVLNKIDAEESEENIKKFNQTFKLDPKLVFEISAMRGDGLATLEEALLNQC